MTKIHIRLAIPEDREDICRVHRAAILALSDEYYAHNTIDAWSKALTPETVRQEIRTPSMTWFVAELAGTVVGFSSMEKNEVSALYVHPDHQNRGIGSKLLARVETEAARQGIRHLTLFASVNSRKFYEAHGYHVTREIIYPLNDEESMTTLSMDKALTG